MSREAGAKTSSATYSRDYWDHVVGQLSKRPLVYAAVVVLVLLYASAIYAPLLANDRPLLLYAVDRAAYESARRELSPIADSLVDLVEQGRDVYEARRSAESSRELPSFAAAVAAEQRALGYRLATMRRYLPQERRPAIAALDTEVAKCVEAATAGRIDASAVARRLRDQLVAVGSSHVALDPSAPDKPGIQLVPRLTFPLFDATTSLEVFFMVLWALVLTWPVWSRLVDCRVLGGDLERKRRVRWTKPVVVVGASLAAMTVWWLSGGGSMVFELAPYKAALDSGALQARHVWFPPLALGFAEIHIGEVLRPPTWTRDSELDDDGRYVRGPRVPKPDVVTGHVPSGRPIEIRYGEPSLNSPIRHILGTDQLGRDMFVRMLYGGRISLAVGLISTVFVVWIGIVVGAVAGYVGGRTDVVLSRIIEIVQSFPAFFLIITAVTLIPEKTLHPVFTIIVIIAMVRWTGVARLVRGEFLKLKEQEFVVAARAVGLSPARVIFRHVLPNAMGPVLVTAAFSVAQGILTESAISFLGLGIKHPIPSWGSLINESRAVEYWWIQIFPGMLIFVTVFCYNIIGEGIRDALDPRLKV